MGSDAPVHLPPKQGLADPKVTDADETRTSSPTQARWLWTWRGSWSCCSCSQVSASRCGTCTSAPRSCSRTTCPPRLRTRTCRAPASCRRTSLTAQPVGRCRSTGWCWSVAWGRGCDDELPTLANAAHASVLHVPAVLRAQRAARPLHAACPLFASKPMLRLGWLRRPGRSSCSGLGLNSPATSTLMPCPRRIRDLTSATGESVSGMASKHR